MHLYKVKNAYQFFCEKSAFEMVKGVKDSSSRLFI